MKHIVIALLISVGTFTVVLGQTNDYGKQIIVQLQPGTVELPAGQAEARLQNIYR